MLIRVHHIAIICSDYGRSKKFYTEVLQLSFFGEVYRKERGWHSSPDLRQKKPKIKRLKIECIKKKEVQLYFLLLYIYSMLQKCRVFYSGTNRTLYVFATPL
ncbi:VOC family protein [Lacibacter sp. H375]|uniref:VOC family protein n=1 Tax=Lacibacter sp. H375 TaxID=3133424 RepID=UPI0030C2B684